jgi:hypothetical protein
MASIIRCQVSVFRCQEYEVSGVGVQVSVLLFLARSKKPAAKMLTPDTRNLKPETKKIYL